MAEYKLDFDELDGTPILNGQRAEMTGTSGGAPMYEAPDKTFQIIMSPGYGLGKDRIDLYMQPEYGDHAPKGPVRLTLDSEGLKHLENFANAYDADLHFKGSNSMKVSLTLGEDIVSNTPSQNLTVTPDYNLKLNPASPVEFVGGNELGLTLEKDGIDASVGFALQDAYDSAHNSKAGDAISPEALQSEIQKGFQKYFETPLDGQAPQQQQTAKPAPAATAPN